jgi:hypothetical protein
MNASLSTDVETMVAQHSLKLLTILLLGNSMGQKIRMLPRTVSLFLLIHSDIHIIQSLAALSSLKYATMG